jgi:glycosyltransferase involved in cell wall biosynthesis
VSFPESLAMKKELVSVVIPLYNHEHYIEECLDSVLAQDMPNIELLLLDDGSSDKGFDVACRWKESHGHRFARIEFDRQANAGITHTFDRLIRKSTGRFILILASDDVLLPGSIAQRLDLFSDACVMAVFGDAIPIDDEGNVLGKSAIGELGEPCSREALSDPRTLPWELIFRWNVYGSVLLCCREALVNPDGSSVLNLSIYSEDMQLYYRLASQGSLRYLDRPVAKYRLHSSNTSGVSENVSKLRRNVYQSRKHSLNGMPWLRGAIVSLQAFTFHRWGKDVWSRLALPLVALSYACILSARFCYDLYRKTVLGQSRNV